MRKRGCRLFYMTWNESAVAAVTSFSPQTQIDGGASVIRERILRVVLVLVGLFFLAAIYPIASGMWNKAAAGETMMLSIYFTLGIFLLLAVRNPSAHRSLIAFAGWANLAHGSVMLLMAIRLTADRQGLFFATLLCLVVSVPLLALLPAKHSPQVKLAEARA